MCPHGLPAWLFSLLWSIELLQPADCNRCLSSCKGSAVWGNPRGYHEALSPSIFTDLSFYGTEDLLGIEAHSMFKHPGDLPDGLDILRNIAIDDHQVGSLTDFDGANLIFQA